jgi:uncharacterized protein (TIGR03435 family)
MIRTVLSLLAVCLAASAADAPPAFDVASIRPAQARTPMKIDHLPGSLTMRGVSLRECIAWAYGVQNIQVSGPDWIGETRFDIAAKSEGGAKQAELRAMLQSLLADRFKLALHRETKDAPALVLTVAKGGHKLEPTEREGSPSFQVGRLNLKGQGATMFQLIDFLSMQLRQPVVDQTGLTGRFNYFLDVNAYFTEEMRNNGHPNGAPPPEAASMVAQAIQAQLGLKVESKKTPLEMLVVDRADKAPTEN